MNLENIVSERSQIQKKTCRFNLYDMSRKHKSIEEESRLVFAEGLRERGNEE